jgi:hypothetical protein
MNDSCNNININGEFEDYDNELIIPHGVSQETIMHMLHKFHNMDKRDNDIIIIHPTVNTLLNMHMLNSTPLYMWSNGAFEIRDIMKKLSVRTVILREIINLFFNMISLEDINNDWEIYLATTPHVKNLQEEFKLFLASLKNTILTHINSLLYNYDGFISNAQALFERAMQIYMCLGIVPYYENEDRNNLNSTLNYKGALIRHCRGHCETKFVSVVERFVSGAKIVYDIPKYENIIITQNIRTGEVIASLMEPSNKNIKHHGRLLKMFNFKNIHAPPNYTFSPLFGRVMLNSLCETMLIRELKIDCLRSREFRLRVKNMSGATIIVQDVSRSGSDSEKTSQGDDVDLKLSTFESNKSRLLSLQQELHEKNTRANQRVLGALKELSTVKNLTDINNLAASTQAQTVLDEGELISMSDLDNLNYNNTLLEETVQPFRMNASTLCNNTFSDALEKSKLNSNLIKLKRDLLRSKLQINSYKKHFQMCLDRISTLGKNNARLVAQHTKDVTDVTECKTKEAYLKKKIETLVKKINQVERSLNKKDTIYSKNNKKPLRRIAANCNSLEGHTRFRSDASLRDFPLKGAHVINISNYLNHEDTCKDYKFLNVKFANETPNDNFILDVRKMWKQISSNFFFLRDITYSINGNAMPRQLSESSSRIYLNSFLNNFTLMKIRSVVIFDDTLLSTDIGDNFFTMEMNRSVLGFFEKRLNSYQ